MGEPRPYTSDFEYKYVDSPPAQFGIREFDEYFYEIRFNVGEKGKIGIELIDEQSNLIRVGNVKNEYLLSIVLSGDVLVAVDGQKIQRGCRAEYAKNMVRKGMQSKGAVSLLLRGEYLRLPEPYKFSAEKLESTKTRTKDALDVIYLRGRRVWEHFMAKCQDFDAFREFFGQQRSLKEKRHALNMSANGLICNILKKRMPRDEVEKKIPGKRSPSPSASSRPLPGLKGKKNSERSPPLPSNADKKRKRRKAQAGNGEIDATAAKGSSTQSPNPAKKRKSHRKPTSKRSVPMSKLPYTALSLPQGAFVGSAETAEECIGKLLYMSWSEDDDDSNTNLWYLAKAESHVRQTSRIRIFWFADGSYSDLTYEEALEKFRVVRDEDAFAAALSIESNKNVKISENKDASISLNESTENAKESNEDVSAAVALNEDSENARNSNQ